MTRNFGKLKLCLLRTMPQTISITCSQRDRERDILQVLASLIRHDGPEFVKHQTVSSRIKLSPKCPQAKVFLTGKFTHCLDDIVI